MDDYSFTAGADYRAYAATMTGCSGGSAETLGDIIASDKTMGLEGPEEGAIGSALDIAGMGWALAGNYYVRVRRCNTASLLGALGPHDFYLRVHLGSPIPETEPTGEDAPQAPRSNGWRGRVIGAATAKNDFFAITVNQGHTIGVIVGVDLERGVPEWKMMAGGGVFSGSFIITL